MTSVEDVICLHGQKRETEALRELVETLTTTDLTDIITRKIRYPNFVTFFNYLLEGFGDASESHAKRHETVRTVLQQSQLQTVSSIQLNAIITRLCVELHKFRSEHLIDLCTFCIECIQKGNSTDFSWKEVFPILLDVIIERDCVEYNSNDMTGLEFKTQLISSLLMMEWSTNIIITMADMFTTMPLTKDEHTQVVAKLGQYIDKLTAQEIPAFVYQMLKLCKSQNSRSIFVRLQSYFGLRVYNNAALNMQNSESMDMIGSSLDMDTVQAESTVLYHIHQADSLGQDCIRDYLSSLKNLTKSPECILHPFQLTVLLTISTISFYEDKVFALVKAAIFRSHCEDHKKSESCWFREMVTYNATLRSTLVQIIQFSVMERTLVIQGLVNLSFVLLGSGMLMGKESIIEKIWDLGNHIIVQLIKYKRFVAPTIIQRLVECIITGQNVHQYIECLHMLSRKYGLLLLENQGCIIQLMEELVVVSSTTANEILDSLIPLTKKSITIRDHLILLLKKALYSRSVDTRQMAVNGFLKLITNLKFTNLSALSQSSNSSLSGHSVFSQLMTSTTQNKPSAFTNEALCLEVLSILRRCFMQQTEVKTKLYEGLYDAVCKNPDLGIPLLELLWSHFSDYYEPDEDQLPPFKFAKVIQVKDMDAILLEPLGKLIYSIALILTKMKETDDDNPVIFRFEKAFVHMSQKMAVCELEHFQLDDGTDLFDVLPESQEKLLRLKEAISVYESLIGYIICSWGPQSDSPAEKVQHLFEGYNRLIQYSKNLSKPKKGDKKKNPNKTSQTLNDTNRKDMAKRVFKRSGTILDFPVLGKILALLHKPTVQWATKVEGNILKKDVGFHQYVMQATINLLLQYKQIKFLSEDKKTMYFNYCTSIGLILYERCVSRFKDFATFDSTTAVLSVETFYWLLKFINSQYEDKWVSFLSSVDGNVKDDLIVHLTNFIEVYKSFFDDITEDTSLDAESVKFFQTVISTISLVGNQIPTERNALSTNLLDWMKQIAVKQNMKGKILVTDFVTFMFHMNIKFKSTTTLFKTFAEKLHDVMGSVSDEKIDNVEEIAIVHEGTSNSILLCLCNELKVMLDDMDWLILRMRSESIMLTYPGEEGVERRRENLKSKERNICCQICQVIKLLTIVGDISVPPGSYCEAVIKCILHLYNTLTNLTKYFHTRSTKLNLAFQTARFECVVKQVGKILSPIVYKFILFVEQNQKGPESLTQAAKRKADPNTLKTKVLKETRLIPKLIYEMEQFSKTVTQLSTKTKVNLTKFVGQGTSRDFRIMDLMTVLQEKSKNNRNADDSMFDADTTLADDAEVVENSGDDSDEPPSKRPKKIGNGSKS